jgi:hypothetical protein
MKKLKMLMPPLFTSSTRLLSKACFFCLTIFCCECLGQTIGVAALPPGSPISPRPQIDATATINFSSSQAVTVNSSVGTSDRVALQPNQSVDVIVRFSTPKTGHNIIVDALDGGKIVVAGNSASVSASNSVHFSFEVNGDPGLRRVILRDGSQEIAFQFWVLDLNNPGSNPATIN